MSSPLKWMVNALLLGSFAGVLTMVACGPKKAFRDVQAECEARHGVAISAINGAFCLDSSALKGKAK